MNRKIQKSATRTLSWPDAHLGRKDLRPLRRLADGLVRSVIRRERDPLRRTLLLRRAELEFQIDLLSPALVNDAGLWDEKTLPAEAEMRSIYHAAMAIVAACRTTPATKVERSAMLFGAAGEFRTDIAMAKLVALARGHGGRKGARRRRRGPKGEARPAPEVHRAR